MIKTSIKILFSFVLIQVLISCRKPPEYPDTPIIEQYKNTEYIETSSFDTIKFYLTFQDGDGNIGLEEEDTLSPFNPYTIKKDANGNIQYADSTDIFNIYTHAIEDENNDGKLDTFRITPNLYYNNILFDFVRVDGFGDIIDTLDFSKLGPVGVEKLDFRIEPLYKKDYTDDVYEGPIDGFLDYQIVSSFLLLPKGTYRLNVTIVDRDLNVSNSILTTPAFIKK